MSLRVAALEAERGARARLRHAERQVVNGAVRAERVRVEEDAPRADRDFERLSSICIFKIINQQCHPYLVHPRFSLLLLQVRWVNVRGAPFVKRA